MKVGGVKTNCLPSPCESLLIPEGWEHYMCVFVFRKFECHVVPLICPLTVMMSLMMISSEENAERIMLDPTSRENPKFKDLLKVRDHILPPLFNHSCVIFIKQHTEGKSVIVFWCVIRS